MVNFGGALGSRRVRTALQAGSDAVAASVAIVFADLGRFDFALPAVNWWGLLLAMPLAAVSQLAAGVGVGVYLGRWRRGSFEEVAALIRACVIASTMMFAFNLLNGRMVP